MLELLKYHFTHLARFSGRETNGQFWPWAGVVVVLSMILGAAVMVPAMFGMFARMQAFAAAHPEQATVTQGPGSYSIEIHGYHPELMPDFRGVITSIALVTFVVVFLLAAAVARRLHDRGKSGAWGLMPLPFLVVGFMAMGRLLGKAQPDVSLFFLMFGNNMAYIAVLIVLIVMLAGAGEREDNRFSPVVAR